MRSIAAVPTVKHLKSILAIHGIPRKIVTDNGPSFVSEEFRLFTVCLLFLFLIVGNRPKDKARRVVECYRCGGNH